jgi:RimJ/RimL family protein N-acetyltransferase
VIGPLIGHDAIVAEHVAKLLGHTRPFVNCTAIGVVENERLVGGCVYHEWDPEHGTIQMSAASTSPRWLNRSILKTMFGYPFSGVGCQLVILRVAESNDRMRRIAKAVGCKEYLIPRLRGRDEAEAVLTLTDDDWFASKFMRPAHG